MTDTFCDRCNDTETVNGTPCPDCAAVVRTPVVWRMVHDGMMYGLLRNGSCVGSWARHMGADMKLAASIILAESLGARKADSLADHFAASVLVPMGDAWEVDEVEVRMWLSCHEIPF